MGFVAGDGLGATDASCNGRSESSCEDQEPSTSCAAALSWLLTWASRAESDERGEALLERGADSSGPIDLAAHLHVQDIDELQSCGPPGGSSSGSLLVRVLPLSLAEMQVCLGVVARLL